MLQQQTGKQQNWANVFTFLRMHDEISNFQFTIDMKTTTKTFALWENLRTYLRNKWYHSLYMQETIPAGINHA